MVHQDFLFANYYIHYMLGIEQKKGNDNKLCGRMIAYAKIIDFDGEKGTTPFDELIKNGLLTLEGDFRKFDPTPSPRRLRKAVDEKFSNLLETMEENGVEIPENLNVEAMRERLHELSTMEVIPIPARIGNFTNEDDILKEDADIYYIGEYIGANQAHFCLTTLPIYYQARYREQTKAEEISMINDMLSQFESEEFLDADDIQRDSDSLFPKGVSLNTFMGDLNNLLNTRVIPFLLACESDTEYNSQIKLFYEFMKDYPDKEDLKRIDAALRSLRLKSDDKDARKLLELSCQKVNALYNENPRRAKEIENEIANL